LVLSCVWHPSIPDLLAITTSDGEVRILKLAEGLHTVERVSDPIVTHALEAWTVAFSPWRPPRERFELYSGGDDSVLNCARSETDGIAGNGIAFTPSVTIGRHEAGVTAILPLDIPSEHWSYVVITGSYDDHIRAFSIQAHDGVLLRSTLLSEENLGGGVWRLRHIDSKCRRQKDPDGSDRILWTTRILASCMHAGARVIRIDWERDRECHITVEARFVEHKSMTYGSDFRPTLDGSKLTCVSTSFYDKLLCVWNYEEPN